jgi:hypothetical protein
MQMIDVLKRLAELDQGNPNVVNPMTKPVEVQPKVIAEGREVQLNLPEPGLDDLRKLSGRKTLTESAIAECGMPAMGAPMPSMPASINMSAGSANEIVSMVRGIMDLAKGDVPSQTMMPAMGAAMPSLLPGFGGVGEPDMDADADSLNSPMGDVDGDGDHDMGDHAKELGAGSSDDDIMDLIKKIRTGDAVKIKTDMPVKVTSDEPIKGRTDQQANVDSDDKPEDEGLLGTMAGAALGSFAGPLGAAVGGAAGDSITGEEESAEVPGKASTTPNDPTDPGRYDPKKGVFVPNTAGQGDRMDGVMPKGNPEKKDGSSNPLSAFESKLFDEYRKFVNEKTNESGLMAWAGRKKHGDEYMKKASIAARDGASQAELGALKDKLSTHEKKKK